MPTFRDKPYEIVYEPVPDCDGECDYVEGRIAIDKGLRGRELLETELHEGLHACLPDTDEQAITETARDVAAWLWQRGYRMRSPRH